MGERDRECSERDAATGDTPSERTREHDDAPPLTRPSARLVTQ